MSFLAQDQFTEFCPLRTVEESHVSRDYRAIYSHKVQLLGRRNTLPIWVDYLSTV